MSTPVMLRIPDAAKHVSTLNVVGETHYSSNVNGTLLVMASLYAIANSGKEDNVQLALSEIKIEFEQGGELEFF